MLARFLPTLLRAMTSGRLDTVIVSPMLTIQPGPSACRLTRRGRSSLMRTIASPSAPRSSAALRIDWSVSALSAARSILAALSNTSHSMSARWNTAAGVSTANGNSACKVPPDCRSSTTTGASGLGAGRLRSAVADFAGGCDAAGAATLSAGLAGAAAAAAAGGASLFGFGGVVGAGEFSAACTGGGTAAGTIGGGSAAASLAGTVSGGSMAGTAAGAAAFCLGLAPSSAAGLGMDLGLAPSWPTSTTMLRSSRKVRTCGVPLNAKLTATESSSTSASIDRRVGGIAALASARSHLIGWSNSSVSFPSALSGTTLATSGIAKT